MDELIYQHNLNSLSMHAPKICANYIAFVSTIYKIIKQALISLGHPVCIFLFLESRNNLSIQNHIEYTLKQENSYVVSVTYNS